MCFNNTMAKKAQELARRYGRKTDIIEIYKQIIEEKRRNGELVDLALEEYRATAFPTKITTKTKTYYSYKKYPIITSNENIQVMEWGLIPYWAKRPEQAEKIRRQTYNACSETIFAKNTYSSSIKKRRCIIPSTGYFEGHYSTPKSKSQPYFIFLTTLEIFSMAGIYSTWIDPVTGEEIKTFSMLTTEGNEKTKLIHNGGQFPFRMPVLLFPEQEEQWLDPAMTEETEINQFLKTFPAENMDAFPVNKQRYLNLDIHDPLIIEPDRSIPNVLCENQLF